MTNGNLINSYCKLTRLKLTFGQFEGKRNMHSFSHGQGPSHGGGLERIGEKCKLANRSCQLYVRDLRKIEEKKIDIFQVLMID